MTPTIISFAQGMQKSIFAHLLYIRNFQYKLFLANFLNSIQRIFDRRQGSQRLSPNILSFDVKIPHKDSKNRLAKLGGRLEKKPQREIKPFLKNEDVQYLSACLSICWFQFYLKIVLNIIYASKKIRTKESMMLIMTLILNLGLVLTL